MAQMHPLWAWVLVGLWATVCHAEAEELNRARQATALLLEDRVHVGVGFCIHPRGYFLIPNRPSSRRVRPELALVLNSGTPRETIYPATVLRRANNRWLVKIAAADLPFVPIGDISGLENDAELHAVVCPLPRLPSTAPASRPAFAATRLERLTGDAFRPISLKFRWLTGLDYFPPNSLPRGVLNDSVGANDGAPVFDSNGTAVGSLDTVRTRNAAAREFGISEFSTEDLEMLRKPEVQFEPLLAATDLARMASYPIGIDWLLKPGGELSVRFSLTVGDGPPRTFVAEPDPERRDAFIAKAIAVPNARAAGDLRLRARFDPGEVVAGIADSTMSVEGRDLPLSQVHRIVPGSPARVLLNDGSSLSGQLEGLEKVEMRIGPRRVPLDLRSARMIEVESSWDPPRELLRYNIVIRIDERVLTEMTGQLNLKPVNRYGEVSSGGPLAPSPPPLLPTLPPALAEDVVRIDLPARAEDVVIGADGRFLCLAFRQSRRVAIFDVNVAKITRLLDVPDQVVGMAASATHLYVSSHRHIHRWDLASFEHLAVPNGTAPRLAIGTASGGPLLAYSSQGIDFLDGTSLTLIERTLGDPRELINNGVRQPNFRASPDGQTFGVFYTAPAPLRMARFRQLITLHGGRPAKRTDEDVQTYPERDEPDVTVGAHGGGYVLAYDRSAAGARKAMTVLTAVDAQPVWSTDIPAELWKREQFTKSRLTIDQRLHFIPRAQVLIWLSELDDALFIRRFDPVSELEASGASYLLVDSAPTGYFTPGRHWRYRPSLRTNGGPMICELEEGPPGMIWHQGELRWSVPVEFAASATTVKLKIRSAYSRPGEPAPVVHSFRLRATSVPDRR